MKLITSYNRKWLFYVLLFLVFFSSVLLVIQYRHEKSIRIDALNDELNNYTGFVENYLNRYHVIEDSAFSELDTLYSLIPDNRIRITLIGRNGIVWYDSQVKDVSTMENHLYRPEVQQSLTEPYGTNIRVSATTGIKYYYHAVSYGAYFIRVSVEFDIAARQFIQPDLIFLLVAVLILFITSFSIILVTDKFGKSVKTLREFIRRVMENKSLEEGLVFPDNELGSIGQEIIDIYQKLNQSKEDLLSEREKLIRHLNLLDEGIAIYSRERRVIMHNKHFIQFINHISDKRIGSAKQLFRIDDFSPLFAFIESHTGNDAPHAEDNLPTFEITLNKSGKYYVTKSIVFQDGSFEVSIQDATRPAKRKLLKQELTENIAHELKTPVSSIKGLLETILDSNPRKEITMDFLRRAYVQSCRLADLINDISLLTKIEEAGNLYKIETVYLGEMIWEIIQEVKPGLEQNKIQIEVSIGNDLHLNGNPVLLYSVFRNLLDNAIIYAGNNAMVRIEKYTEDSRFYYFSFSDNGLGVPEEDLPRLFERFYRVDKGRDRKKGGTGLGLAIVKNAIEFHGGEISVKNRNEGGLEFLFTISKELD